MRLLRFANKNGDNIVVLPSGNPQGTRIYLFEFHKDEKLVSFRTATTGEIVYQMFGFGARSVVEDVVRLRCMGLFM